MYKYTSEIIDSITHGFCVKVLVEKDLEAEFFDSGYRLNVDFIKNTFKDKKDELKEMLEDYFESGEAEDDLTCGNAEYWLDEFDILNIEDEMLGNEYDLAKERMMKFFSL